MDITQTTEENVLRLKDRKQKLTELKGVSENLIREKTLREIRENPTVPPLYHNLEIARN